ncbi:hypothetical protein L1987_55300 [Smallanthus sonchifolius]|uniref:Uncharacterized protein n=1 Tax=Smallanthus sonchifolius TaxID=185202 RepID=A0ACB9E967_9ASTR|nr:hypothetical protein L1987_55300 [Smallanthus sonchifolius]
MVAPLALPLEKIIVTSREDSKGQRGLHIRGGKMGSSGGWGNGSKWFCIGTIKDDFLGVISDPGTTS